MLFGHLAVSALEHRYAKAQFVPVMTAAVFPDVVDKTAYYILRRTNNGRLWAHTLLGALLTTGIVLAFWGKRPAWSWMLGYLSHLVCDIGGVVPWLYPFVTYEFPPAHDLGTTIVMSLTNTPRLTLEVVLSIWALLALYPESKGRSRKMKRAGA